MDDQSPYESPQEPPQGAAPLDSTKDDRLWAMLSHLSYLVGLGVLAPLIIWLVKKEESPFIEDQAKESLNFQLAVMIVVLVTSATCIGAPLAIVAAIGGIVYSIIGAMESNKGVAYRYPYTFRIIK